jgi:hypothetical protein
MQLHLLLPLALILCSASSVERNDDLEQSIQSYWDAIQSKDKVTAMQYVFPEDLNNFLNKPLSTFTNWELAETEQQGEGKCRVTVTIDELFPHGLFKGSQVSADWEETTEGWKVRVPPPGEGLLRAYGYRDREEQELPARLSVFPKKIRFYAMAKKQPGSIMIRNGLGTPVTITGLEFDAKRFKLQKHLPRVEAGQVGYVRLDYVGEETEPNLESKAILRLEQDGQEKVIEIPIIYNYEDNHTRWIQGRQRKPPG